VVGGSVSVVMLRSVASGLLRSALPQTAATCPALSLTRGFSSEAAHKRKLSPAASENAFGSITIGQVMKEKAQSGDPRAGLFWCRPQEMAFEAVKKMAEANVGSILVMNSDEPHRSQVC
jgi:hypothetical protein